MRRMYKILHLNRFPIMKIDQLLKELERWAAPQLQESYDNAGLITGNAQDELTGVLFCLDSTEAVVQEAISKGYNLIVAHHPIVFSGLKRLTGASYIERTVMLAIRNNISIYAIHTNLDNVHTGVSAEMAKRLGLINTRVLQPKKGLLRKLVTYVPDAHAEEVRNALFAAGAGHIGNYDECSFNLNGTGTFRPNKEAQPFIGEAGIRQEEPETRIELVAPFWIQQSITDALFAAHPYEEVAYDWTVIENNHQLIGAGMVGDLANEMDTSEVLGLIKNVFGGTIRYTTPHTSKIKRIALCGGSGSFLLKDAIRSGADLFLTADFKYHQFFDAEGKIIIADIGHFESEQFTMELIHRYLNEKIPNFAGSLTTITTNPIHYL